MNREPDAIKVKPFISTNLDDNFLFSKSDIFISTNDTEHK
jgi:hypothetical protein